MKLIQFTKKALLFTTLFSCLSIASYAKNSLEQESKKEAINSISQLITQLESQQKDDTIPLITLASNQRRLLAFLIDFIVMAVFSAISAAIIAKMGYNIPQELEKLFDDPQSEYLSITFFIFFLIFLQEIFFYKTNGGGGVGKYLLGIEVVDAKGLRPSKKRLFIRALCKYLFAVVTCMGIPFKAHNNKQALHDIIAGTHAIRKEKMKKTDFLMVQENTDKASNITSENMVIAPALSRVKAVFFNIVVLLPLLWSVFQQFHLKFEDIKFALAMTALAFIPLLLIIERWLGKRVFHIKIVDKEGKSPSLKASFIRTLWKYGTFGVSFLWTFLNEQGQALHDQKAGTYVVAIEQKIKTKGDIDNLQQMISSTTVPKSKTSASADSTAS